MEGRYSFNCSIAPAAESTKLYNSSGNNRSSFSWGSSPISSRQRSNSITNLISLENGAEGPSCKERSSCKTDRKIDPRIVADVQSKGLASRIVKYHENGKNRLNRSMSAHNLFCKPGHFPTVTLQKTDLPYRATRQNLSMTRIVPPEKSMFYGNTLSSLLRSTSVIGLQKSDEDISRENRPILHPPPTENDMAPTRSVLDVLKEISRKRINSDDPNTLDASKKNRIGCDLLDVGTNATLSNIPPANMTMMANSYKRQREITSSYKMEMSAVPKFQDTNKSPEQAKKRVCSYNNDITSSLSSSTKRKPPYDHKRPSYQLNMTMPTYLEPFEAQKVKMQKCHDSNISSEIKVGNLNLKFTDYNKNTITLPTKPSSIHHQLEHGVAPQRSKSEPLQKEGNGITQPQNIYKPRLTLFNKNYDVINETCDNDSENGDNFNESSECAGIHFVKPKKLTSTGLKNPTIERTQKSKLALMLSGLRGELYQGSDSDELDSAKEQQNIRADDSKQISGREVNLGSSSNITSNHSDTPRATSNAVKQLENITPSQFKVSPSSKHTSPLVGLKLTPQSNINTNAQKVDAGQQLTTPMLGGFSSNNVLNPVTSVAVTSTNCNSVNVSSVSKTVITSVPFVSSNQSTSAKPLANTCVVPTFSFGTNTVESNITGVGSSVATATITPITESFTVGSSNTTNARNESIGLSIVYTGATSVASSIDSCNPTNAASRKDGPSDTSVSTSFNFGHNENAATSLQNSISGKTEMKPVASSAALSFGASSNTPSMSSSCTGKTSQDLSFVPSTSTASNTFSFGSSVTTNKVSTPLTTSAFTFGCSSSKGSPSIFSTSATNLTPPASSTSGLGVTSFNQTSKFAGLVSAYPAPNTTLNLFASSNVAATTSFGKSESKNATTAFGSTSVNNTTTPSLGFAFGTESKKTAPANGSFTFENSGNTAVPVISAPASNTKSCDKRNITNIFGGAMTVPSGATAPSTAFSFGSSANAGIQKSSTFSFGSASILPMNGNSSASQATGFSFAATTPSKPKEITSNNSFSFGLMASSTTSQVSNNQTPSNLFAPPEASKGSTPTFNFGATTTTNTQSPSAPNTTNNIFALPSSASGDRPIRRATRRLQK